MNKRDRVKEQYKNHHKVKVKVFSIELDNRNNLDALIYRDRVFSIELDNRNNLDALIYRDRLIDALLYIEID